MKRAKRILFLLLLLPTMVSAQYLHQQGKYIVDGDNNEFIIRSMGLGGWMLQEGYMLGTGGFAGTQHEIRALMEASMGKDRTDEFYDAWLANHCTREDIDSLASWGFNAVRPALHYNLFTLPIEEEPVEGEDTWLEKGFQMVDELLEWCKANDMYVILDLHAAPGGQGKNADISDYDPSKPSLWESSENQRKTVAIWRKLAERYANEKYIGGYDLINETNWNFNGTNENGCDSSNERLKSLMIRITNAIREVDQNHLVFIEGNCWANNMTGMFPPWDDNMAYSFHKYWNATDKGTIGNFLSWRDQYEVPFWLGESGENSNQWFYETINMLESQKIGWSWWPLKKIGSVVGPLTAIQTPEYSELLETWRSGGTPDPDFCYNTLMQITENLMIENCEYHPDVIDAMFRQQTESSTIPFKKHEIPGVINLTDFDMGRLNEAYYDVDFMNDKGNGGAQWNNGWIYRNDGVDMEATEDDSELGNGYNVGWTADGEWMVYTVDVKEAGAYKVTFRVASTSSAGKFHLEVNQKNITGTVSAVSTGDYQQWQDVTIDNVILEEGMQKIKFVIETGGFNIHYIQFSDPKTTSSLSTKPLNGYAAPTGDQIILAINKSLNSEIAPAAADFKLTINGTEEEIETIGYDSEDPAKIILTLKKKVENGDNVLLSYTPGNLAATDEVALSSFTNLEIDINIPQVLEIPGKIEAEDFDVNEGLTLENCTDAGGGYDMGYTDNGDYLDYQVDIAEAGNYTVSYRIASENTAGGKIDLKLISGDTETILHTVSIPYTAGWQTWKTVTANATLPEGTQTLRVFVKSREFNLNWLSFQLAGTTSSKELSLDESLFNIYPNPATDKLYVDLNDTKSNSSYSLKIININGAVLKEISPVQAKGTMINLDGLQQGIYFLQLNKGGKTCSKRFLITNRN